MEEEDLLDLKLQDMDLQQIFEDWKNKDLVTILDDQIQLIERAYLRHQDVILQKVSSQGITVSNDTSLEDAMKALVEAKKDSVTVVKGDEKLGSISMYDIVHAATRSSETAGEAVTYR